MIIATKCSKCDQEIKKWTWYSDRVELAKSESEFLEMYCKSCNTSAKYHVDSFNAEPNKLAIITATAVFLIGTPLVFYFIWDLLLELTWSYSILKVAGLLLIPVIVYGIILKNDRRKVNSRIGHSTALAEVSRPGIAFEPRENPEFLARVAGSPAKCTVARAYSAAAGASGAGLPCSDSKSSLRPFTN